MCIYTCVYMCVIGTYVVFVYMCMCLSSCVCLSVPAFVCAHMCSICVYMYEIEIICMNMLD